MTQHPFDHEFSEQEAAKLNAEQERTDAEELTDEEMEQVAGGLSITWPITKGWHEAGEGGITKTKGEEGGISKVILEAGNS